MRAVNITPMPSEHEEQVALFKWADYKKARWPELELMYAIPNGGKRDRVTAALLKAEGVKPGVPDICLPVRRDRWCGVYIELKTKKGKVTPQQRAYLLKLREQGYVTAVCRGWYPASELIKAYMSGVPLDFMKEAKAA